MPTLVIGIGKAKPMSSPDKEELMGEPEDLPKEGKEAKDDSGDVDAALDDAYDALKSEGDAKDAFKSAMRAAIAACCADMYDEKE